MPFQVHSSFWEDFRTINGLTSVVRDKLIVDLQRIAAEPADFGPSLVQPGEGPVSEELALALDLLGYVRFLLGLGSESNLATALSPFLDAAKVEVPETDEAFVRRLFATYISRIDEFSLARRRLSLGLNLASVNAEFLAAADIGSDGIVRFVPRARLRFVPDETNPPPLVVDVDEASLDVLIERLVAVRERLQTLRASLPSERLGGPFRADLGLPDA